MCRYQITHDGNALNTRPPPRAQISASTTPPVQTAAPSPKPHSPQHTSLVRSPPVPPRTTHCTPGRVVGVHRGERVRRAGTTRAGIDAGRRLCLAWIARGRVWRGFWRGFLVRLRGDGRVGSMLYVVWQKKGGVEGGIYGEKMNIIALEWGGGLTPGAFVSKVRMASLREVSLRIFSYCFFFRW